MPRRLRRRVRPAGLPRAQRKNPRQLALTGVRSRFKSLAVTYFHIDKVDTSIGAERFHFRVRKGIGWFPLAMAARQNSCRGTSHVWPRHEFGQFVSTLELSPERCRIQDQSIASIPYPICKRPGLFRPVQIAWVLYGQASRAISTS
jgi:hypothetical protein